MALDYRSTDYSGLVGRNIAGGLRVTQRTGSTSQGPLYEAEDLEGRRVVLLVLPAGGPGQEPAGVRSFKLATRIRHPNVAAVQAVGELEDGSAYVVLEQAVGDPLGHLLSARSTHPIGEALELILQVAAGLEAVHHAGFFHGNVSPSTIVVTRPPFGKSQIKLVGFSLDTDPQRAPSLEAGSTPYASPERRIGGPPDARGDVFSVGAVLHHILCGRPPIDGQVERVPRIARPVLKRALARQPGDRFRTMSELREALEVLAAAAVTPADALAYRRILSGAIVAGLVLVVGAVLLAPVWRSFESRTPAIVPPAAPGDSARRAEPRRSTEAGRTASELRARPAARRPAGIDPPQRRPTEERSDPPEAAGYVAQSSSSDASPASSARRPPPPQRASSIAPTPPPPPPASPSRPRGRPLMELEQNPALRLAMGDVTRVGLAENLVEAQPGLLIVQLAPEGMDVPSASYNLQRLYLAYSAANKQLDTVALELRQSGKLYGWFTREGLRYVSPDGARP
jgi:serine/threonine protein kinase